MRELKKQFMFVVFTFTCYWNSLAFIPEQQAARSFSPKPEFVVSEA
jgi:hypothetical protein